MAEILLGRLLGPSGFDRAVVIKRILPHLARQKQFQTMFLDEARIVASIAHPNVVSVLELGREGDEIFLVFEYLEGESLSALVRALVAKGATPELRLCAHILAEACAGLHAAHETSDSERGPTNLVHRDVSPQNLFLTYDGQVKVIDFGIATAADRVTRTETGQIKGKFEYMSPEHCRGEPLDRRSDIFSLGIVLFETTTGRRLFKRASAAATISAIAQDPVVPPSRLIEGYPLALESVCLKALARSRDERYASAAEMRRDLLVAMRGMPVAKGASEDPAAALAQLMTEKFKGRLEEKREMLRRVRTGSQVTHVPSNLDDDSVGSEPAPAAIEVERTGTHLTATGHPEVSRRTGAASRLVPLAVLALAGTAVLAVTRLQLRGPTEVAARALPSPAPSAQPAPSSAATAQASAAPAGSSPSPSFILVHVETKPAGARVVVGGVELGVTPVDVRMPQGTAPVALQLHRRGYETLIEQLVPASDQRLLLALEPTRGAPASVRAPAPAQSSTASPTPGFRRFN